MDDNIKRRSRTQRVLTDNRYAVVTARTPRQRAEISHRAPKIHSILGALIMEDDCVRLAERMRGPGDNINKAADLTFRCGPAEESSPIFGPAGISTKSVHM